MINSTFPRKPPFLRKLKTYSLTRKDRGLFLFLPPKLFRRRKKREAKKEERAPKMMRK